MSDLAKALNEALSQLSILLEAADEKSGYLSPEEKNWQNGTVVDIKKTKSWLEEILADCKFFGKNISFQKFIIEILKDLELKVVLYFLNSPSSRSVYDACGNRLKGVLQLKDSYKVMRDLDFGDRNTVVVGANGCGKTSLATQLQQIVHKDLGIVLPAQRVLLIPNIRNIPSKTSADAIYETFDRSIPNYKKKFSIDNPTGYHSYEEAIGTEFTFLLIQLFSEKIANYFKLEDEFKANPKNPESFTPFFNSKANEVIEIWESLFPGLILKLKETGSLHVRRKDTTEYDGNSLSEGEKEALYLIGRVLLAPKNSLIIVDEPEAHLHKSVVCALWDKLEQKREDCVFFYFTHDIDFAVTRDAKKIWIKSFEYPNHWDFRFLSDDTIPEDLYLELLGSKRKILFCEGDMQSFNYKLYSALFPDLFVVPVENCSKVRAYTRAMNSGGLANVQALGIIDRDLLTEEDVSDLMEENIYVLGVSEIENVFLLSELLKPFASAQGEDIDFDRMESEVLNEIAAKKDEMLQQARCFYATQIFSKTEFKRRCSEADILQSLNDRTEKGILILKKLVNDLDLRLSSSVSKEDYATAVEVAFDKGLITTVQRFFFSSNADHLREKLINFLKHDRGVAEKVIERIGLGGILCELEKSK